MISNPVYVSARFKVISILSLCKYPDLYVYCASPKWTANWSTMTDSVWLYTLFWPNRCQFQLRKIKAALKLCLDKLTLVIHDCLTDKPFLSAASVLGPRYRHKADTSMQWRCLCKLKLFLILSYSITPLPSAKCVSFVIITHNGGIVWSPRGAIRRQQQGFCGTEIGNLRWLDVLTTQCSERTIVTMLSSSSWSARRRQCRQRRPG